MADDLNDDDFDSNSPSSTNSSTASEMATLHYAPFQKLVPPLNFCPVEDQLYRSGQPTPINFPFLKDLALNSVVWLEMEDPSEAFVRYARETGIKIFHLGLENGAGVEDQDDDDDDGAPKLGSTPRANDGALSTATFSSQGTFFSSAATPPPAVGGAGSARHSKTSTNPWDQLPEAAIVRALDIIAHKENYPLLVCGGMGRHRTGTVIGCLRRVQHWNLASVSEEYRRFAGSRKRVLIELHIEAFNVYSVHIDPTAAPPFLL
ncbi:putative tyrosine protein phosphatase [Limtongia smithiae]|uniref:putative tyrosine protein phosphatase n=1 Tax=Limtongia smithiae TaxID=1125753 RepID=UPI0034CEC1A2